MSLKSTAIACAVSVALAGMIGYKLHAMDVERIEARAAQHEAAAVTNLSQADQAQCSKDKAVTEEISNAYQHKISALNSQLNNLRGMRPATCVLVSGLGGKTNAASGHHAAAGTGQHADPNGQGVKSDFLYSFAGECEHYRIQLISTQDFINKSCR